MRKGIFERAYLNWHYRKDILMKDISERAFPKGHFDEGHFEGRAFPKGERAKGMKGIVHKLEFPPETPPSGSQDPPCGSQAFRTEKCNNNLANMKYPIGC